jgi:hypothetical protein
MKKLLKSLGGLVLSALLFTGCVSAPQNPMTEAQRTDKLAIVLKTMVADVVILALDKNPDARPKVEKARDAMNLLISNSNTTPRDIVASIMPLLEDAKPEVRIAASTIIGVLDAYWGEYVIDVTGGNENALKFLRAVLAGLDSGLALSPVAP